MAAVSLITGTILLMTGVALNLWAFHGQRSSRAPRTISFHPRNWRPLWRTRDWFNSVAGYRLYVAGGIMWLAGLMLLFVGFLLQIVESAQ